MDVICPTEIAIFFFYFSIRISHKITIHTDSFGDHRAADTLTTNQMSNRNDFTCFPNTPARITIRK